MKQRSGISEQGDRRNDAQPPGEASRREGADAATRKRWSSMGSEGVPLCLGYVWGINRGTAKHLKRAYYKSYGRAVRSMREEMFLIENLIQSKDQSRNKTSKSNLEGALLSAALLYDYAEQNRMPSHFISLLIMDLFNLYNGVRPSDMLSVASFSGRPRDPAQLDDARGRVTALYECKKSEGYTRQEAFRWIKEKCPKDIWLSIGDPNLKQLDSWRGRWQYRSEDIRDVPGHVAYKSMTIILQNSSDAKDLGTIFDKIRDILPK